MSMERSRVKVLTESDDSHTLKSSPPKALQEIISRPFNIPEEEWKVMSEEERVQAAENYRAERKVRLAQVLERGVVSARLQVPLPPDVYGEWFRNDPEDLYRAQLLGFKVDDSYAVNRALHSDGDGKPIIGDVVFMTCPREDHELMQEIKQEKFDQIHGTKPSQDEEQKFKAQVATKTPELPVVEESRVRKVRKEEISAALDAANR